MPSRNLIAATGVLLLVWLLLVAAGCGDDDGEKTDTSAVARIEEFGSAASDAERREIEAALNRYLGARAAGEWKKACSYIAQPIRRLIGRAGANDEGCAGTVERATKRLPASERVELAKPDVELVRVKGDSGYAIYTSGGARYAMPTIAERARWYVVAVSAQPLT